MTYELPTPPAIPASNASYSKIISKIQSAAKHGPEAVKLMRDTIRGTNTYCRITRRYADQVLEALAAPPPAVATQASEELMAAVSAKASAGKKAPAKLKGLTVAQAAERAAKKAPAKSKKATA